MTRTAGPTLYRAFIDTPVGRMRALATDEALCAFEFFIDARMGRLDDRLHRWFGSPTFVDDENEIIGAVRRWCGDYFTGTSPAPPAVPLDMRGATFEREVWTALTAIPAGTTTSYGAIARALGKPGAARAVGMANGANPIAIIVPCHRVVGANGTLTGYGGGLDRKQWLLRHEQRWGGEPFELRN